MKKVLFIFSIAIVFSCGADPLVAQSYKIKQTNSMNGQKSTSTTYVKGSRKRTESSGMMGMGADVADIEQCDLKQNVKVNDKKKLYIVEPFDTSDNSTAPARPAAPKAKTPVQKGGTITYVNNVTDTGERKTMFGMTARHLKTSMSIESTPDACSRSNMKMESDGWYIDLPEFSCPVSMRPSMPQYEEPQSGCKDKVNFRNTGGGKLGFALSETRNMTSGGTTFTQTVETVEFSKATLDQSLFDVPTGYTVAGNSQDLYGKPDMAAMMRAAQAGNNDDEDEDKPKAKPSKGMGTMGSSSVSTGGTPAAKHPGTIRIGVLAPTNKGENISITNMQSYLAQQLTSGNVEGVAVGSEADAKANGCDYILWSDFSKLKQSTAGKIGGMFGKITNTSVNNIYEAQVDFKLVSTASGQVALQNKAASKAETDVDRAAQGVLAQEAAAVVAKTQK